MKTGFEHFTSKQLAELYYNFMEQNTLAEITASLKFLRLCQEFDNRKKSPWQIAYELKSAE